MTGTELSVRVAGQLEQLARAFAAVDLVARAMDGLEDEGKLEGLHALLVEKAAVLVPAARGVVDAAGVRDWSSITQEEGGHAA